MPRHTSYSPILVYVFILFLVVLRKLVEKNTMLFKYLFHIDVFFGTIGVDV